MTETTQTSIQQIHTTLQTAMKVTSDLMTNRDLLQWERINFEKAGPLFDQLGLKEKYQKSFETFRGLSREILREVEQLENELNSLTLDVKRTIISPAKVESLTKRLEQQCNTLQQPLEELQEHCTLLLDGQEKLREMLTIQQLLPVVREYKDIQADKVNEGYRFLSFISDEQSDNATGPTLAACQAKATRLEQKFKEIEVKGLPGLAAAVLEHQIYAGVKAADQVKAYIEDFNQYPPSELEEVTAAVQTLNKLRQGELATIAKDLPDTILTVGRALSSLCNRAKSLRQMELLPVFLKHLDLLQATISGPLMEDLKMKARETGSPLNPVTVAAEKVPDFFMGFQGLLRTLKLLLQSFSGQKSISASELQYKAVTICNTCHTYYGTKESDLIKLQSFLEDHLAVYSRPFPHDALFLFLKGVINAYGNRLEKYVGQYKIPEFTVMEDRSDRDEPKGKMTLGRLVNKIEVWTEHFEVY